MEEKNRYRFVILATVILVRSCIGLIWASAGPLLPLMMEAYGLSRGTAGWFASAAPLTIAAVALPVGIIGARYSLKRTFAVGAFLQAAGILAPLATSYPPLVFTRVIFAVGTAITVPVAAAIATEWFTSRRLPIVNGVTMSFVNLGNAVAFVATVPIATVLSWEAPITVYGAFALTCAVAWAVFGRDRRRPAALADPPNPSAQASEFPLQEEAKDRGWRQVLTRRSTVLLAVAVMGSWGLGNAVGAWLPTYYHEVFKMPLDRASSILAVLTVGGTAACIAGGIIPVRVGRRKPFLILSGIFMGVTALSAIMFNNLVIIYLSVALFGIFANLQAPSLFTIPMELPDTPLRSGVIVISVMQVGGNLGNFISPLVVGYLADITGSYLPGFIIFAVLSLSLLAAGLLLPETGPKGRRVKQTNSPRR